MLSKEEIEKDIKLFKSVDLGDDIEFIKARKNLLQYIQELEADNYESNNIISEYIDERKKLIDKMKADRMEQFDDYVIYLIESYLKELGALEDE